MTGRRNKYTCTHPGGPPPMSLRQEREYIDRLYYTTRVLNEQRIQRTNTFYNTALNYGTATTRVVWDYNADGTGRG